MDGTNNEAKKIVKEYDISSINTLVDLNEDLVNFKTDFKVFASSEDSEFSVAVADQTQVDNGDFSFRDVKGKIGGNISWDKNVYKNHFLALKSKEPQKVTVELELTELPRTPDNKILEDQQPIDIKQEDIKPYQVDSNQYNITQDILALQKKNSLFSKLWFKIFLVCVLLIIGVLIYKYFFSKSEESVSSNDLSSKLGMGSPAGASSSSGDNVESSQPVGQPNEQGYRPRLPPVPPLSQWNAIPSSSMPSGNRFQTRRPFQTMRRENMMGNNSSEVTSVDELRNKIFGKN